MSHPWRRPSPVAAVLLPIWLVLSWVGCHSGPRLQPVDLARPGWLVQEGQALWTPASGQSKVAGDLLLATHPDGSALVQFSKTPFPLVTAQRQPGSWSIDFVAAHRKRSGRGHPPSSLVWLHLPSCFQVSGPPQAIQFHILDDNRWRLTHTASGQSVEGFLKPTRRPGWHRVRDGESLPFLLFVYGLPRESLADNNPGVDLDRLTPGLSLRLPAVPAAP